METKEQYVPTQEETDYVNAMAAQVLSELEAKRKFNGRRNRKVWSRMNRPCKIAKIDKGSTFINGLLAKVGA